MFKINFSRTSRARTGWDQETGSSQRLFQPAMGSFYLYKLKSRDSSPINGASENNSIKIYMQKFDHRSLNWDHRDPKLSSSQAG